MLGVSYGGLISLESGTPPSVYVIKRIRLMERIFKDELEVYYAQCKKFRCKWTWGNETKIYGKYEGDLYVKRAVGYRNSHVLPKRKEDIEALGGLEVFRNIPSADPPDPPECDPRLPAKRRGNPNWVKGKKAGVFTNSKQTNKFGNKLEDDLPGESG